MLSNCHCREDPCPGNGDRPIIPLDLNQHKDKQKNLDARIVFGLSLKEYDLTVNSTCPARLTFAAAIRNLILLSIILPPSCIEGTSSAVSWSCAEFSGISRGGDGSANTGCTGELRPGGGR